MRIRLGIAATVALVAMLGSPVEAQNTGPVRITFKVKHLKPKSLVAKLRDGLKALPSVDQCAISARSGKVMLTMKPEKFLKLSELRAAVRKVDEKLKIEEEKLAIAGAVVVVTSLAGVQQEAILKALKAIKNVKRAKEASEIEGIPKAGTFELLTKQPKGVKLGAFQKALGKLKDGDSEIPAVIDIVWVSPKAKPKPASTGNG